MIYRWPPRFFGLPKDYRKKLHEEIFGLCYYSNGGFSHTDVYTMPVYLRRFYTQKLIEHKNQEKEDIEKSMKKSQQRNKSFVPGQGNRR